MNTNFDPQVIGRNQRALFELELGVEKARTEHDTIKRQLSDYQLQIRRLQMTDSIPSAELTDMAELVDGLVAECQRVEQELQVMDRLLREAQSVCQD